MSKSFVLHDETVNTYEFRMLTSGADLSEFVKNPVMLLNHNDLALPIGRWENIRIEGTKILADPVFDLKDERGKQVSGKVDDKFLNAASIGAWPPLEISDDPALKLAGQKHPTVTKWKVREASIVTIGSNHNALVFYDSKGKKIDMHDATAVIKLIDNHKFSLKTENTMELNKILKLADTADDAARVAAVNILLADKSRLESDNVRLKGENTTLTTRIDEINNAAKQELKNKGIALVDAAIKDGRLNADGKESFVELFDLDFAKAEKTLAALPKRKSVSGRIDNPVTDNLELADLSKKEWGVLDKENKLTLLHDKYPELYKEKFKARFGTEPK